jgi:hypothetical protein
VILNNPFQELSGDNNNYMIGSIFTILGAIGSGSVGICLRIMKNDTHYSLSPFWYSMGLFMCAPAFHFVEIANFND